MASSKPRILIAAGIYPPDAGGPAVHAKAQYEGFPKFGIETGLVAFAHYRKWPRGIRHLLYFCALLLKIPKYDIIYAHDAVGVGIPAFIAARIFGKKFMVRIGGDVAWELHVEEVGLSMREWYEKGLNLNDRMFKLSRWLMRRADLIVVIGESLKNLYINYYGINPSKIKVIINPLPEIENIPIKEEKSMIFASRLTSYKNLPAVLRALSKVVSENKDFKFIIMGDGPDKDKLRVLSKNLNLESNVIFAGSVPLREVMERTASSLFTIAPALTEFNPNYVLQGIAFGKPFLISRENDLPFEVPEEFLIDPRNESEVYHHINWLLTPDGYSKAKDLAKSLKFKMSWDDNLMGNIEAIKSLLKG